ncbi:MAG TPA: hypothetical protein VFB21_22805 [Chthonomonadaceae bacterium]|nr:hypothetical protein [Chthonomonadaceae bacterium]
MRAARLTTGLFCWMALALLTASLLPMAASLFLFFAAPTLSGTPCATPPATRPRMGAVPPSPRDPPRFA